MSIDDLERTLHEVVLGQLNGRPDRTVTVEGVQVHRDEAILTLRRPTGDRFDWPYPHGPTGLSEPHLHASDILMNLVEAFTGPDGVGYLERGEQAYGRDLVGRTVDDQRAWSLLSEYLTVKGDPPGPGAWLHRRRAVVEHADRRSRLLQQVVLVLDPPLRPPVLDLLRFERATARTAEEEPTETEYVTALHSAGWLDRATRATAVVATWQPGPDAEQ